MHEKAINKTNGILSERLKNATTMAPITNPNCTAIVSQTFSLSPSPDRNVNSGKMTVPENQVDMAPIRQMLMIDKANHGLVLTGSKNIKIPNMETLAIKPTYAPAVHQL